MRLSGQTEGQSVESLMTLLFEVENPDVVAAPDYDPVSTQVNEAIESRRRTIQLDLKWLVGEGHVQMSPGIPPIYSVVTSAGAWELLDEQLLISEDQLLAMCLVRAVFTTTGGSIGEVEKGSDPGPLAQAMDGLLARAGQGAPCGPIIAQVTNPGNLRVLG